MEDGRQSPIKNGDFPLKPPARRRFGSGIAITVCLLIALGPVVFLGLRPEIARWYVAAAMEHDLLDELEAAEADLDKAIEWLPEDGDLYVRRADIRLQQKDFPGAMDDCQVALQSNGQDFRPALLRRMLVHQRQRHHEKAIAESDLLVERSKSASERAESLNARAYARALGNVQITEGLEDIQAAFEALGTEDNAAFLDTRGYLYYLNGDFDEALRDMERAVQMAEDERSSFVMRRPELQKQSRVDERLLDRQARRINENLAVLYQHRGLVYEALDRPEEAEADFERADKYGYSPEDGVW